jgi:hypothetical protein
LPNKTTTSTTIKKPSTTKTVVVVAGVIVGTLIIGGGVIIGVKFGGALFASTAKVAASNLSHVSQVKHLNNATHSFNESLHITHDFPSAQTQANSHFTQRTVRPMLR